MMKNKIFIVALLSMVFFGCSDQLDRTPVDELVESTAFQTVSDLEFGMNAFIGNYNPQNLIQHNSIFTDNVKLGLNNGGQELNALNQILNAETGDRGMWNNRYGVINDVNRVIVAAGGISPGSAEDQAAYDNVLAQCYAFRALAHWDLLLYYGLDVTDGTAAGVPYVDFVSSDALPSRNTTSEVLAGIQADLDAAAGFMAGATANIDFATPDFITFLRARIALETGDYPGAISNATTIINNYSLADPTQYFNMFNEDADVTEVIWRYNNVQGFSYNIAFSWNFTASGTLAGSGFMEMSNGLLNSFDPNDIRRVVCYAEAVSDVAAGEILIGKYPPNADTQFINDFKAMRASEAYLIRAEAYARTSQLPLAAGDVLAVRDARLLSTVAPFTYNNQTEAMQDILQERRHELAFEGHRYNDIKRMRDVLNMGIERDPLDCPGGVPCSLPVSSEKWIFPVPQAEINANPNIQQAPGYGN